MKQTRLLKLFTLIAFISIITFACKKEEIIIPEKPSTQSVDDNADAESEFNDIFSIAEDAMDEYRDQMDKSPQGTFGTLGDTTCATVSIDTLHSDSINTLIKGRITIDFGATDCTGSDGRTRRGKIYVDYTGKYRTVGTIIKTSFDQYFVNKNQIEGTKIVTRISDSVQTINVNNAKITWLDKTTTLWESTRTRTWTGGKSTISDISDDVYTVKGTSKGTNRAGSTFQTVITDVTLKLECWLSKIFYPVSGTITVTPDGTTNPLIINYGSGTCDKNITVTYNGIEYDHELK